LAQRLNSLELNFNRRQNVPLFTLLYRSLILREGYHKIKFIKKMSKEIKEIKSEIKQKIIGYIVAAFSLVAGFAWNEAVKSLIEYIIPLSPNTLLLKFVYAVFITLLLVFVSIYLVKLFKAEENK
jgi:hypothetical protein